MISQMRLNGATGAGLLLVLLVLEVPAVSVAQPLNPAAAADAAFGQRSGPFKGAFAVIGNPNAEPSPVGLPVGAKVLQKRRTVKELPSMSAMTMPEMKGMYSGATAPRAVKGRTNKPRPLANGEVGSSFSDSRFTSEYFTLGQGRVGRWLFRSDDVWYSCTASVIQRAVLLTAAHCVCNWGKGGSCGPDSVDGQVQAYFQLHQEGDRKNIVEFSTKSILLAASYVDGTDTTVSGGDGGVIVNNDLALVWLAPNGTKQVGDFGGWNAYGYNGYGFAEQLSFVNGFPAAPANAMVSNIGYSYQKDNFTTLQISHAPAYHMLVAPQKNWHKRPARATIKNMVRATSLQAGSSGAPWIVNYGIAPVLENQNLEPLQGDRNVVIGVTSWGPADEAALSGYEGASFFGVNPQFPGEYGIRGSGNIAALMDYACDKPGGWELTAKGLCVDE